MKTCVASEIVEEILKKSTKSDEWVFDCDGTLINGDISILVGWYLIKEGLVDVELIPDKWKDPKKYLSLKESDFEEMRDHMLDLVGHTQTYEWEIKLQSGLPTELVKEKAEEVLQYAVQNNLVYFTNVLPHLVRRVQANSWLVSGSSRPTVTAISRSVGIADHRVLATELDNLDGVYTQNFDSWGVVWEGVKKDYLLDRGVVSPYFVAGDTIGDWAMMLSSKRWVWCVLWDHLRHRGEEFRAHLESQLDFASEIPKNPGFYRHTEGAREWVFEVQSPSI